MPCNLERAWPSLPDVNRPQEDAIWGCHIFRLWLPRAMSLSDEQTNLVNIEQVQTSAIASFKAATRFGEPYTHWNASGVLPHEAVQQICDLPFAAPDLAGISGKREIHNATRTYFDADNQKRFSVVRAVAEGFQSPAVTQSIETAFGAKLSGSYLRMEYAQDIDGFWLQPHSDLGVKLFTLLLYLSDDPRHAGLGTDIYDDQKAHFGTSPFRPNVGMIFVPSGNTFHGFEPRKIEGVRKSLIVNYVTDDWRAREQLAFPDQPIAH